MQALTLTPTLTLNPLLTSVIPRLVTQKTNLTLTLTLTLTLINRNPHRNPSPCSESQLNTDLDPTVSLMLPLPLPRAPLEDVKGMRDMPASRLFLYDSDNTGPPTLILTLYLHGSDDPNPSPNPNSKPNPSPNPGPVPGPKSESRFLFLVTPARAAPCQPFIGAARVAAIQT